MSTAPAESASGTKRYTATEAADEIGSSAWLVKKVARDNGIGYLIGGPTGYRFLESDLDKIREVLRPKPAPARRRGKGRRR